MKASKKLIASFAALVVAVALAVTSTYAWFSMSATPSIEGLNVNVTAGDGVLISLSGAPGSYKAVLTVDDFIALDDEKYAVDEDKVFTAITFEPVTSTNGTTFTKQDGTTAVVKADNKYLDFEVHFLADVATTIKLSSTGNAVTSEPNPAQKRAIGWDDFGADIYGKAVTKNSNILADAKDAIRLSFTGSAPYIWEPNATAGYSKTGTNLALDYYNYINGTTLSAPAGAPLTTTANLYNLPLVVLAPTTDEGAAVFKGTITVRVWLEGWDGDCFDSIKRDKVTINLQFEGSDPE